MTIFSLFSDLSLLVQNVPEEYGGRIQADKDSVHIEYKGIKFGVVVDRREPFSLVVLKDDGQSFLPFTISFFMDPVGIDSTLFHIELTAELNFMMKMMIGNKLQEMVDSITDQIEKAINSLAAGQSVDFSDIKPPVSFS
jgi:carbon monoxide dehydrogenase subunit G